MAMAVAKPFFVFDPSPEDVLTYYLPRWIHGEPLIDTVGLIREAHVYDCEPGDLAGDFPPVPKTGERFFFTWCKRAKGDRMVRTAGAGTWVSQAKKEITSKAGQKIGYRDNLRFKKGGVYTDWLMEEYRCFLGEAVLGNAERVLCKIYVSPRAPPGSAARQESAAFMRQEPAPPVKVRTPVPRTEPVITHAPKRPAPVAEPPCPKRMRGAVPTRPVVQPACVTAFEPQRQAPLRPTPLVPRRVMAPGPAPPAPCLPRPSVPTCPVVQQGFVARPAPACLRAAPHRPLTEAPAAAEDDVNGFAKFLEGIIEAADETPIEDMDQFVSSLEDMLGGAEDGALPTGRQNPAADADDDMDDKFARSLEEELMLAQTEEAEDDMDDKFASSLEEELMLAQTEEAEDDKFASSLEEELMLAQTEEAEDDMDDRFASSLEEELMLAQTEDATEEQTAEGAEVPSESAMVLRDFLARYGETESEVTTANELQEAFDVLNGFGDDQIDDAFLTVPLKDYNDQLFY